MPGGVFTEGDPMVPVPATDRLRPEPHRADKVVEGTCVGEYLELNRKRQAA
jgi:hypothetical protein